MSSQSFKVEAEWGVLAFCVWQAADLLTAWRNSPFDHLGWLALGFWLVPTLVSAWRFRARLPKTRRSVYFAWLGLAVCLAGILTDMHFLKHGALALACAAITPQVRFGSLWLVLALAWMPALGWLLAGLPAFGVAGIRLTLAALAALIGMVQSQHNFQRALE